MLWVLDGLSLLQLFFLDQVKLINLEIFLSLLQ